MSVSSRRGSRIIGLTGADAPGARLLELLEACGIDTAGVQQDPARATTVKTRVVARNQQVVRIDRERNERVSEEQTSAAMRSIEAAMAGVDAVVVADYGKGFLTQQLADSLCRTARLHGKVLAVDPHPYTSLCWRGATVIKPNRAEAFLAAGLPPADPGPRPWEDAPLLDAGRRLLETWQTDNLIITLGEDGMLVLKSDAAPYHTPARAKEVFDVSGAGDTAIAVLTLAFCAGASAPRRRNSPMWRAASPSGRSGRRRLRRRSCRRNCRERNRKGRVYHWLLKQLAERLERMRRH